MARTFGRVGDLPCSSFGIQNGAKISLSLSLNILYVTLSLVSYIESKNYISKPQCPQPTSADFTPPVLRHYPKHLHVPRFYREKKFPEEKPDLLEEGKHEICLHATLMDLHMSRLPSCHFAISDRVSIEAGETEKIHA